MNRINTMIAVASLMLTVRAVWAQQAQPTQISQDAYYLYSAEAHDAHAHAWARVLRQYFASTQSAPLDLVADTVTSIRRNIQAAQKAYGKLSDAAKKEPQTARRLAEIEKQHVQILELCKAMDAQDIRTGAEAQKMYDHCDQVMQRLTATRSASSVEAALSDNIVTRELEKPGRGAFSD